MLIPTHIDSAILFAVTGKNYKVSVGEFLIEIEPDGHAESRAATKSLLARILVGDITKNEEEAIKDTLTGIRPIKSAPERAKQPLP